MGNASYVRAQSAANTKYETFAIAHSQRAGGGSDGVIDADTGKSPGMRVLAYAFSWEDVDATTHEVHCRIPSGTLVKDAWLRIDVAFAGGGSATALTGDATDPNGYMTASDLTAAAGTYIRTGAAAYLASQARAYPDGGTVIVDFGAGEPTAGQGILFLSVPSYHEPLGAEWL